MDLSPEKIYEDFQRNDLDKSTAFELLISLIEHSDDDNIRVESIENLEKIGLDNSKLFKLFESLMISDSSEEIRSSAAKVICNNFLNKALSPVKWVLLHDSSYDCIITVINTLVKMNDQESKDILIGEIKRIQKLKYILEDSKITNKLFKKAIKKLFKNNKIETISQEDLADIIINFKTISALKRKFYSVYYELEDAKVVKLDLSDIEYEVRGWKAEFKNNILEISDIIGISNLKQLRDLYLSNNQIKDIGDLITLTKLTHLDIANNQINDEKNLEYLKQISNQGLKYLNISGNKIADIIHKNDFNPELEIKLTKTYY